MIKAKIITTKALLVDFLLDCTLLNLRNNKFYSIYIFLSAKHQKFSLNLQIYCLEIFYGFDRHISRSKTANLFAVFFVSRRHLFEQNIHFKYGL